MAKSSLLISALKSSEAPVKHYVRELESENAKLHRIIAKLESKNMSQQNRIAALEKDIKQRPTYEDSLQSLIEQSFNPSAT